MVRYFHLLKLSLLLTTLFLLGLIQPAFLFAEVQTTANIPWSGYWWQFIECGLATGYNYYNNPSPLEKYELYKNGIFPGELTNWYKAKYCSGTHYSWAGHCGHWALAATCENNDILPSSLNNIVFRVGDKKGLLTLMHNNDTAVWGNGELPQQFHLWLLRYIKDEKKAFIADLSTGKEIWQYPVYKYNMTSSVVGNTESVTVEIFYADDFVHPDYIGTKVKSITYTYNLFLNSSKEIIGGEWTGYSIDDHPERMYFFVSQGTDAPAVSYNIVKDIVRSKDDFLENHSIPVPIASGTYNLILMDPDVYRLDAEKDNTILINLELLEGGGDNFNAQIIDNKSSVVGQYHVTMNSPVSVKLNGEHPPYTIRVFKNNYSVPGIYRLKVDSFRPFSTTIPYIPKDGNWSGFAITNFNKNPLGNIALTAYTKDGKALRTLLGPETKSAGEKDIFLFRNLSIWKHEFLDIDTVRITAPEQISVLNLFGTTDGVTTLDRGEYKGAHLVLPDTVKEMQADRWMFAKIINESSTSSNAQLTLHNSEGTTLKTVNISLDPRQTYSIHPGQSPFSQVPDSGWIDILCKTEGNILSGFQYIKKNHSLEANLAIPVTDHNKIVPHIPGKEQWKTQLVLINNSNAKANFVLHRVMALNNTDGDFTFEAEPKSRTIVNLHDNFDTSSSSPYYRSILSVTSDQEFSGYFSYKSFSYGDYATIPLLETRDFGSSLILTHNTPAKRWWTGLGIVNPGATTINVLVKAYGKNGELLNNLTKTLTLSSGEYDIFSAGSKFLDRVADISFIKFESEKPSEKIGGFFMYGSNEDEFCGANLQVIHD